MIAHTPKRIYIAGPMRGYPLYNFSEFFAAARVLHERYPNTQTVNPAQVDMERGFNPWEFPSDFNWKSLPEGESFDEIIDRDLALLRECDAIYMLEGWKDSEGAIIEYEVAKDNDLLIMFESSEDEEHYAFTSVEIDTKPTNPKDACGVKKVPLNGMPAPVLMECGLVKLHGDLKYGRYNWREAGVRYSVYYDACMRHLMAWWEGEDLDPDSGLPHLTHAMTGLAVLRDAIMQDMAEDDRPPMTDAGWIAQMNEVAAEMIEKHGG